LRQRNQSVIQPALVVLGLIIQQEFDRLLDIRASC
jgi:hypothetical protein